MCQRRVMLTLGVRNSSWPECFCVNHGDEQLTFAAPQQHSNMEIFEVGFGAALTGKRRGDKVYLTKDIRLTRFWHKTAAKSYPASIPGTTALLRTLAKVICIGFVAQ